MFCALSWIELITESTALPIWSSPKLNGGPCSHSWTSCSAVVAASESSVTWSATDGAIAAMIPTKSATATRSTVEAASAGGHRCLRRNRVVGQSTVAMSRPRTIGSRIDHSLPSTQNSDDDGGGDEQELRGGDRQACATRAGAWGPGPPSAPAPGCVWAPGSSDGPPEAAEARVSSDASGAVSSRERPGTRSLMRVDHNTDARAGPRGNDHRDQVVASCVMPKTATADRVDRDALLEFLRPRHQAVLLTRRREGGVQLSPVSCGVDGEGRIVVSTYPQRAKVANARREPAVSLCVLSSDWNGPWVQVDGEAEVLDLPEALEPLVEYYRSISGEHPDWDEYRAAMTRQGKSLLRITITGWGPIATGGFPPEVVDKL